jgi:hypothetical protein
MRPLLAIFFVALLALTGQPAAASVGFTVLQVPDGAAPPVEVISHGNGGFFAAVFFAVIAPSSQRSEPPANPARFTPRSVSPERRGR